MPIRERPWTRPPGPGPSTRPPGGHTSGAHRPLRQPLPAAHQDRKPRKIAFADELPSCARARPGAQRPSRAPPGPNYELKYPPLRSERGRCCYAAVFRDQYWELIELQKEVQWTQAKLGQLEALLRTLPPARSQKEAHMAAHIWRALEKRRMDPAFLDKQARCCYLKGKLRHLKTQIQKFDDQENSKGSVYF